MICTLRFAKRFCRYVTENRIKCQVLPCGFRTYHHYFLGEYQRQTAAVAERNLLIGLQTVVRSFSSGNVDELIVKHDPIEGKFYVNVAGVGCAYIEYERRDELVILKHTDVPGDLGGRGIGKILVKEALEFVAKNDLQLEIQCSFVRKYVSKYEPNYMKYIIQK